MSQAGRIPARGAHLSGQEPGRHRARPPEKAVAPAARGPAPRPPAVGQGRSHPFRSSPAPGGSGASPPLQAPDSGAELP